MRNVSYRQCLVSVTVDKRGGVSSDELEGRGITIHSCALPCTHTYIHACIHTYICTYAYADVYISSYIDVHLLIHTYKEGKKHTQPQMLGSLGSPASLKGRRVSMVLYIYIYIYAHTYVYVCLCIHIFIQLCIDVCICLYINILTHIYIGKGYGLRK